MAWLKYDNFVHLHKKSSMKDPKKEQAQKKQPIHTDDPKDRGEHERRPNTKVETDTGKRPEKDTNPLPPNPNKVDNH